jgi:polyribonucleotide nucleotidyltransferase
VQVTIPEDMIGKLIGPGGKTINAMQDEYGVKIEVEDDGTVTVSSEKGGRAREAAEQISHMGRKVRAGELYEGTVTDIKDFGAIVELFPGSDGLCHISELDESYVRDVKDVCKVGDKLKVKVLQVEGNRVRLSRKAALKEEGGDESQ